MLAWFLNLKRWGDLAPWHSWVLHALIAVPLCLLVGPWATFCIYLFRELEQMTHRRMGNLPLVWDDHIMDVVGPAVVAAAWARWDWWTFA